MYGWFDMSALCRHIPIRRAGSYKDALRRLFVYNGLFLILVHNLLKKWLKAMNKITTLCRNSEFQRLYRKGKSAVRSTVVVYCTKGRRGKVRLGITAGKKIGGAVCRNRAKRRIRELFRIMQPRLKCGLDICIVARNRVLTAPYDKLVKDFTSAADELALWNENQNEKNND